MKIVVDAMGGDLAPLEVVLGSIDALNADKDARVVLVGDVDKINPILSDQKYDATRLELVDAKDVITNDESPTMAIKLKKESSLVKAFEYLMANDDAEGFVSAGSTGAVLVGAFMKVGRIKGVSRPALAPILPTAKGNGVVLCDCGANVDCKAINLLHFAIMGRAYARAMLGVEEPRIALLSNGVEDHKGNELCHEAFELLKQEEGINFVGNCEARDILTGDYDLIVTDGFNGNIALKSAEGAATTIIGALKEGIYGGGLRAKLGGLLLKPTLKGVMKRMDYNAHGGACFLGVNKVVVKSHGASKRKSICASILQAKSLAEHKTPENIKVAISAQLAKSKEEAENA